MNGFNQSGGSVLSRERIHLDWKLLDWTGTGSVSSELGVGSGSVSSGLEVETCCLGSRSVLSGLQVKVSRFGLAVRR